MDFDPKTSRLHNKEVDKYLANYDFRLNSEIKIKFSPHGVDVSLASPNDGICIYMHPPDFGTRVEAADDEVRPQRSDFLSARPSQFLAMACVQY